MIFFPAFPIQSDCQIVKSDMTDEQKVKFAVEQMELNQQDLKDVKGKGAKIAIIDLIGTKGDKGFHCKHKAFDGIITEDDVKWFKKKNFKDATNHATVCAGIAVGKPYKGKFIRNGKFFELKYEGGVAPKAKASIFLIERDSDCFLDALEEVERGGFDVVSISLNYPGNCEREDVPLQDRRKLDEIRQTISRLSNSTVIVISAGNSGRVQGVLFPANIKDKVISVGGYHEFGRELPFAPDNVSINGYGQVCAPATGSQRGYLTRMFSPDASDVLLEWSTGTSMAAPAIAGLICLFIQCAMDKDDLEEAAKQDFLRLIKQKDNMMRILKETIDDQQQIKPANTLRAILKKSSFKEWFDEISAKEN